MATKTLPLPYSSVNTFTAILSCSHFGNESETSSPFGAMSTLSILPLNEQQIIVNNANAANVGMWVTYVTIGY